MNLRINMIPLSGFENNDVKFFVLICNADPQLIETIELKSFECECLQLMLSKI